MKSFTPGDRSRGIDRCGGGLDVFQWLVGLAKGERQVTCLVLTTAKLLLQTLDLLGTFFFALSGGATGVKRPSEGADVNAE
jgi:hypothetical protein